MTAASPRAAVFAGSFDPVTRGHVDLVRRAAALFDRVVVAVAVNSGKRPLFALDERVALVEGALAAEGVPAAVERLEGLLVAFARRAGARALVRGVRGAADFEYEVGMARMNAHLAADLDTVFLAPAPALAWISSTLVREGARYGQSVDALVTPNVAAALRARFAPATPPTADGRMHAARSSFLDALRARAAAAPRRIAFAEPEDARTQAAVRRLLDERVVRPVLVIASDDVARAVAPLAAAGAELFDARAPDMQERAAAHLLARRAARGLTADAARALAAQPLYAADALVALGECDGSVAGAVHTTADVLRAALWTVGPLAAGGTVSSAFYMVAPDFRGVGPEVLTFTDCAVVPEPTAEQLVDIARAAAADRPRVVGDRPRVAFLSYSTHGSGGDGASVRRVRRAAALLREALPGLPVDGDLQADAALIPDVARRKAPGSVAAGEANVLVFPSLDAGNIGYKLVQRVAGASAVGPILQGLARPCSDLSRGASPDDIVHVAAITALQAAPR